MALFQKQPLMRRVLYSLVPIYVFAFFLYGLRVLWYSLVIFTVGILTEYVMEKRKGKSVTEAVLVTCSLLTLSMPPSAPLWVAGIASFFGVFIAKEVYGGFGRNVFNPAIVGRLFVYITFPVYMTTGWIIPRTDAITSATPLDLLRAGETVKFSELIVGVRSGSLGESPILLIVAAAVYLIVTKTASWRIILSTVGSAFGLNLLLNAFGKGMPVLPAMLSGSLLFVAVFMATDPVSAPKKTISQWFYGMIIGCVTVIIRNFSLFSEGTSFGVLMGNIFASLLDELRIKKVKK
ncbi:RnfABCDGE type electron transport complex subunit D [Pseudothermotoga thermarum]|uniref:NQR2 and RnfD family protein n=1 Tax=Pseudothermotoga thermarum DSM 5069 TaxID=688269 RepID=F7YTJ8_9THEM|nr:RnfABCDGE type electron transport complex subunit D [Pseudothermotoga thermarum]AEH51216.1 NQR2 and RnfD family protein [Pseudothermotoga thermarum DSM 5069]